MKIGFVATELFDGRFVPWESSLRWESYLDLYALALSQRGHQCVKYVPSIGISKTVSYVHKFGHGVKRIPCHNRILAPSVLLRPRAYEVGYTTIAHPLLAPSFTLNLLSEAVKDDLDLLHYSSYYSSFFIPASAIGGRFPIVVQYTGGAMPGGTLGNLAWRFALFSSLRSCKAVLIGDYASERRSLVHDLSVPESKLVGFNAPIVDEEIFKEGNRRRAQERVGFDPKKKNILCVSYIPRRHSLALAKDPYLMIDTLERAIAGGGDELMVYVAGWGTGEEEFKNYIRDKGLQGRVRTMGMIDHAALPIYYWAADLVFLPFRLEKLNEGSVTVEAFSCGRPVVAFKRRAEDKTDQAGGFLIDDSPIGGSQTLLRLIRQDGYLEAKGREGRQLSEEYTLRFAGRRLEQIYGEALHGRSAELT